MTRRRFTTVLLGLAVAAPALVGPPAAHADTTGPAMIAGLNAQREANGIPGGIAENPEWSSACAKHMQYVAANTLTHEEDPSRPQYSAEGDWAGRTSVLTTNGDGWADGVGPWENAPIHLMQLLAPSLSVTGAAPGCMVTWKGYQREQPPAPQLLSYPGDARTAIPFEQVARESPMVPGDAVGLPEGTTTGPHLYVLAWGSGRGRIAEGSLQGPSGPVEIRSVDNQTPQVGSYLPPGGILIPARPLAPLTTYTARVSFTGDGAGASPLTRTWSFTTRGLDPELGVDFHAGGVSARSKSGAPMTLAVRRLPSGQVVVQRTIAPGRMRLPLEGARYELCVTQPAGAPYDAARSCTQATVRSTWRVRLTRRAADPRALVLRIPPEVAGAVGTLSVRPLRRRCQPRSWSPGAPPFCRLVPGRSTRTTLTLRDGLRVRVPVRRGAQAQVRLRVGNGAAGERLGVVPDVVLRMRG
jgi:hypothetical protein